MSQRQTSSFLLFLGVCLWPQSIWAQAEGALPKDSGSQGVPDAPVAPEEAPAPVNPEAQVPETADSGTADAEATDPRAAAPATRSPQTSSGKQPERQEREVGELRAELAEQRQELAEQRSELDELALELELQAELEATPDSYAEPTDPLKLYGFMDMGFQKAWFDGAYLSLGPSTAATFVIGNINLYLDAQPWEHWRALLEVRLTTYPNGAQEQLGTPAGTEFERTSTRISDVNNPTGAWVWTNWGSIVLERAHIDWSPTDLAQLRVGYWLTPFGIWNVDHGSPTLLSLMEPQFIATEFIPRRQIGVQALGSLHLDAWELGYRAYVSNGRSRGHSSSDLQDFTDDKMYGGRLFVRTRQPLPMAFGTSLFSGQRTSVERNITRFEPLHIEEEAVVDALDRGIGVDASIDVGRLKLRAEAVVHQLEYEPGKQEPAFGPPGAEFPSTVRWSTYLLTAYRLPWFGLEPYVYGEVARSMLPLGEGAGIYSAGLNVHFNPRAQLKTQYSYLHWFDFKDVGHDHSGDGGHTLASRLVLAF